MKKILIIGASTGMGRLLVKKLIDKGYLVWAVARRQELLKELKRELSSNRFYYSKLDVTSKEDWQKLIQLFKKKNFKPDSVVLNAAIFDLDFDQGTEGVNIDKTRELFEVNFFGVLRGVNTLVKQFKDGLNFILISSSSALKGSGREGIGYGASKAAASLAFESFSHRYSSTGFNFTTIYFGPITGGMNPNKQSGVGVISQNSAINTIIKAIMERNLVYHNPRFLFLFLILVRLLPMRITGKILNFAESRNN